MPAPTAAPPIEISLTAAELSASMAAGNAAGDGHSLASANQLPFDESWLPAKLAADPSPAPMAKWVNAPPLGSEWWDDLKPAVVLIGLMLGLPMVGLIAARAPWPIFIPFFVWISLLVTVMLALVWPAVRAAQIRFEVAANGRIYIFRRTQPIAVVTRAVIVVPPIRPVLDFLLRHYGASFFISWVDAATGQPCKLRLMRLPRHAMSRLHAEAYRVARDLELPVAEHGTLGNPDHTIIARPRTAAEKTPIRNRHLGGFGIVFSGPRLALKTLQRCFRDRATDGDLSAESREIFAREAAIALALPDHPALLAAIGITAFDGVPLLITEPCAGGTLADFLARQTPTPIACATATANSLASVPATSSPLSSPSQISSPAAIRAASHTAFPAPSPLAPADVASIGCQLATALFAAETFVPGFVHGDIKPANILLSRPNTIDRVRLADFGLATATFIDGHRATTRGGTPAYLAPECWAENSRMTSERDVYALGVTLFELAAGRRPFAGATLAAMHAAHATDAVPELPGIVPPALADLIRACLAKDPFDRPTPRAIRLTLLAMDGVGDGWQRRMAPSDTHVRTVRHAIARVKSLIAMGHPKAALNVLSRAGNLAYAEEMFWQAVAHAAIDSTGTGWRHYESLARTVRATTPHAPGAPPTIARILAGRFAAGLPLGIDC